MASTPERNQEESFLGLVIRGIRSLEYNFVLLEFGFHFMFMYRSLPREPTYGILGIVRTVVLGPLMSLVTTLTIWIFLTIGNLVLRFNP